MQGRFCIEYFIFSIIYLFAILELFKGDQNRSESGPRDCGEQLSSTLLGLNRVIGAVKLLVFAKRSCLIGFPSLHLFHHKS